VPRRGFPNLKRLEEDKLFYDEEGIQQGFNLQKLLEHFLPGICYQLNLPNGFENAARNQLTAILKILKLTVKKAVGFGSKSAKRTTLLSRFKNVIFRHRYIIQKSSSSIETEQC